MKKTSSPVFHLNIRLANFLLTLCSLPGSQLGSPRENEIGLTIGFLFIMLKFCKLNKNLYGSFLFYFNEPYYYILINNSFINNLG
jgi:hypothetical protein